MKTLRLAFLFACLTAPLAAQTAKTRADLYTQIATQLASGQPITAAQLRAVMQDVVASGQNPLTDGSPALQTGSYANPAWITALDWSKITSKPTLGTASALDVAASGNAGAGEVVKGDDTRLTDSRSPTAHSHPLSEITDDGTAASRNVPAAGNAAASEVVLGNDTRLTDSRAPAGAAGGVLGGTYPNPSFAADMATQAELDTHTGNVSNPHGVTAAQVGLGAVNNTSDLDKPISTLTQAALDAKVSLTALASDNASGVNSDGLVHWTQIIGMPAGFSDGTDDGAGGTSYTFSAPLSESAGTVSISAATTGAAGTMSAADKTKLDGIAAGATVNSTDAQLRDRSTHTGAQAISTVTGLQTALDAKVETSALAAVATSGAYNDLTGKPTLGTAAALDVPAAGDAASGQVVKGSDTRLTNSRAPTAHTHPQSDVTNLTTDLAAKAPLASPALTGTPTAPTASAGNNSTQIATTAYVDNAARPPAVVTITSNTTLTSTHRNKWIRGNSATDITLTIDTSSLAAEDELYIEQQAAGKVILAGSGVTLNKSTANATVSTRAQYSVIGVKAISTSVATVFGDVTQ